MTPDHRPAVIDTVAFSALFHQMKRPDVAAPYLHIVGDRNMVMSFVTVAELRFGALKGGWGVMRRRALERDLAALPVVQPDDQLIQLCADLRHRCERLGHPIGQKIHEADRWIAATALRLEIPLVSGDHVFDDIEGLEVLAPAR